MGRCQLDHNLRTTGPLATLWYAQTFGGELPADVRTLGEKKLPRLTEHEGVDLVALFPGRDVVGVVETQAGGVKAVFRPVQQVSYTSNGYHTLGAGVFSPNTAAPAAVPVMPSEEYSAAMGVWVARVKRYAKLGFGLPEMPEPLKREEERRRMATPRTG